MAFTAADVMRRASTILQDGDAVHWTATELRDWLNEGMRAIVTVKPNATAATATLPLTQGTKQILPAAYTMLHKAVRNTGGKAIKTLARREILDNQIPDWHSTTGLPFHAVVDIVMQDAMSLREFYVAPGNTGSGSIEAIVGFVPVPIPLPSTGVLDVSSYTTAVPFDDVYQGILLDLVLFRAFSKDSAAPAAAQRAQAHLGLAQAALQGLGLAQGAMSLAAAYGVPAAAG